MMSDLQQRLDSILALAREAESGSFPWDIVSLAVADLIVESNGPDMLDLFPERVGVDLRRYYETYKEGGEFFIYSNLGPSDQTELIKKYAMVMGFDASKTGSEPLSLELPQ